MSQSRHPAKCETFMRDPGQAFAIIAADSNMTLWCGLAFAYLCNSSRPYITISFYIKGCLIASAIMMQPVVSFLLMTQVSFLIFSGQRSARHLNDSQ